MIKCEYCENDLSCWSPSCIRDIKGEKTILAEIEARCDGCKQRFIFRGLISRDEFSIFNEFGEHHKRSEEYIRNNSTPLRLCDAMDENEFNDLFRNPHAEKMHEIEKQCKDILRNRLNEWSKTFGRVREYI